MNEALTNAELLDRKQRFEKALERKDLPDSIRKTTQLAIDKLTATLNMRAADEAKNKTAPPAKPAKAKAKTKAKAKAEEGEGGGTGSTQPYPPADEPSEPAEPAESEPAEPAEPAPSPSATPRKGKGATAETPDCDELTAKWIKAQESKEKSVKKRKKLSGFEKLTTKVEGAVVSAIKSIPKKEIKEDPSKAISNFRVLADATEHFLRALRSFMPKEYDSKVVDAVTDSLRKLISDMKASYTKAMGGMYKDGGYVTKSKGGALLALKNDILDRFELGEMDVPKGYASGQEWINAHAKEIKKASEQGLNPFDTVEWIDAGATGEFPNESLIWFNENLKITKAKTKGEDLYAIRPKVVSDETGTDKQTAYVIGGYWYVLDNLLERGIPKDKAIELLHSAEKDEDFYFPEYMMAKGGSLGAMFSFGSGPHYNTGLSWHQDRARHNKSEPWENRGKGAGYAKGGAVEWNLTEDDVERLKTGDNVEYGHWNLNLITSGESKGQYEAVYDGLYMEVFANLEDLKHRRNQLGFYEYDKKLTEENGVEAFTDKDGNVRKYAKGGTAGHYNRGLSWHQDRARHNKSEPWENREKGGLYEDGGYLDWRHENDASLRADYSEYRENMKLDGFPASEILSFPKWAKERYEQIQNGEMAKGGGVKMPEKGTPEWHRVEIARQVRQVN